jgi:hypothetical protein
MKTDNDLSFPAWLWVILGAFALIAATVTFKMVQAYSAPSTSSAPTPTVAPNPAVVGNTQPGN